MIIDAHTHLFSSNADAESEKLLRTMDRVGIDRSILFPSARNWESTEIMIRIAQKHPDRFSAVGSVSPLERNRQMMEALRRWLSSGVICGVKFFLGYEHFYPVPQETKLKLFLDVIRGFDVPVIFHTGDTYNKHGDALVKYAHPLAVDELAVAYPNLTIVIAHLGFPWIIDAAEVVYKNKNVYADISGWAYGKTTGMQKRYFRQELMRARGLVLESFDKLIFGTDWPISDSGSYLGWARDLPITASEKRLFFSETARKVYRIA